jgi:PEP-CTERM motif
MAAIYASLYLFLLVNNSNNRLIEYFCNMHKDYDFNFIRKAQTRRAKMRHARTSQPSQRNRNGMAYRLFCGLLAAGAAFGLLASGAASAVLIPGDQAGAFAEGSINSRFIVCSTCSPASDLFGPQDKGGIGNNGPVIVGDAVRIGTGAADYEARAIIFGPTFLPELTAEASATPGIGPHAGFSADGAYFFTAAASAHADQYFTYIGRTPSTYTIGFSFRGDALGAHAEDDPFVTVSGTIALFDDRDRSGEFPKGHEVDEFQKAVDGTDRSFDIGGSVSITVNRGDSFYLSTFLDATVTGEAEGIADARHTFTTSFTGGDTSLLVAKLGDSVIPTAAVPEPSTWVLMILGFGAVAGLAGRRRLRATPGISRAPWR